MSEQVNTPNGGSRINQLMDEVYGPIREDVAAFADAKQRARECGWIVFRVWIVTGMTVRGELYVAAPHRDEAKQAIMDAGIVQPGESVSLVAVAA